MISITINISDYKSHACEERKYLMSHFPTLSYIRPLDMRAEGGTYDPSGVNLVPVLATVSDLVMRSVMREWQQSRDNA